MTSSIHYQNSVCQLTNINISALLCISNLWDLFWGVVLPSIHICTWFIILAILNLFKIYLLFFLQRAFTPCFLSYWVSLLCSHFLSLGWDNPPCRGLQSAGRPGKSLNYPFALKLEPNHNSPRSVLLRTPASLGLIVGLDFFFSPSSTVEMERWN